MSTDARSSPDDRYGLPPARVLLCLHPDCHHHFYLPLDADEAGTCPNDNDHPVTIYDLAFTRWPTPGAIDA